MKERWQSLDANLEEESIPKADLAFLAPVLFSNEFGEEIPAGWYAHPILSHSDTKARTRLHWAKKIILTSKNSTEFVIFKLKFEKVNVIFT
jgi:hypothetical protein